MKPSNITFVGDISLNGIYDELLTRRGPSYPFEQIKDLFSRSDIIVGNLESPFVPIDRIAEYPGKTPLRADPSYAEGLRIAGFNLFNLSNNHILDYGEYGVEVTRDMLSKHSIDCFGYGDSYEEARRLKIIPAGPLQIGFMGYTDVLIDSPFYASENSRGIAKFDIKKAKEEVRESKKKVDALIVSLHWGIEYFHLPRPEQLAQARALIDCGVDAIIGHHPHIMQGIEHYKNGLIAYSLGNFIFSDIKWEWQTKAGENRTSYFNFSSRNRKSYVLQLRIDKSGLVDYSVYGTYLSKSGQVVHKPRVIDELQKLSDGLTQRQYEDYFARELKRFKIFTMMKQTLPRLKRLYKLRQKHIKELSNILWTLKKSK
jgi:poly-gamma-glutamate capsule biosynthesis protein CapA/YwtB (metallophosphatase superfamily)